MKGIWLWLKRLWHSWMGRESGVEIERKFLIRLSEGALRGRNGVPIAQAYLQSGDPELRIRRKDEAYFLAYKQGGGLRRVEREVEVPSEAGVILFKLAQHGGIQKIRYGIGRWEIDLYEGSLRGLLFAEVELSSEDEPLPLVPPGMEIVEEVTLDKRFKNQALAKLSETEARSLVASVAGDPRAEWR